MIKRLLEHYRAERAYKAREKYVRERQRGFQDAMRDWDRGMKLAQMFDPSVIGRTPYGDGYAHGRDCIRSNEEMLRRAEEPPEKVAPPRRKMTVFKVLAQ